MVQEDPNLMSPVFTGPGGRVLLWRSSLGGTFTRTDPINPSPLFRTGWTRVIVEKPFGRDSASSKELSEGLSRHLREDQTYRIDHYLGEGGGADL